MGRNWCSWWSERELLSCRNCGATTARCSSTMQPRGAWMRKALPFAASAVTLSNAIPLRLYLRRQLRCEGGPLCWPRQAAGQPVT